jgi:RNA polymerase sigma-70 factor (ECF subfamily)
MLRAAAWRRAEPAQPAHDSAGSELPGAAGSADAELIARACAGDRAAWGALIARHDHRVVLSLLARGVALPDARELAQRTWTRLIGQHQAGRLERLELPGLAIRQARFLAVDAARRQRVAAEHVVGSVSGEAVVDESASAEDRLIHREQLARATAALAQCSPAARRVFELLYAHPGMSHRDAAEQLGLSVQRVRQTLCEVRARLRAALEDDDGAGAKGDEPATASRRVRGLAKRTGVGS